MFPEDVVLIAIINNARDFAIARDAGWYRIPAERAPDGIHAEYLALYQTKSFGDDAFAINYYARINGVELVTRRDLFPDEPDHPHAPNPYYKLSLGPLVRLPHPIISRKWRRLTFLVTTGERFQKAWELNDLVLGTPEDAVVWRAIRDVGREHETREPRAEYETPSPLWYAFSDESGDTSLFAPTRPFLCVAAILTRSPRGIELRVTRALKKWGIHAALGELKASHLTSQIAHRFLMAIAEDDISIVGVVLDKRVILRPPKDSEDLYRAVMSKLAGLCVDRCPRLEWYLDKRYTHPEQGRRLERQLRNEIASMKQEAVLIFPAESHVQKELQASDFVAWALAQKYLGNGEFWKLIEQKVIAEEVIRKELW